MDFLQERCIPHLLMFTSHRGIMRYFCYHIM